MSTRKNGKPVRETVRLPNSVLFLLRQSGICPGEVLRQNALGLAVVQARTWDFHQNSLRSGRTKGKRQNLVEVAEWLNVGSRTRAVATLMRSPTSSIR